MLKFDAHTYKACSAYACKHYITSHRDSATVARQELASETGIVERQKYAVVNDGYMHMCMWSKVLTLKLLYFL